MKSTGRFFLAKSIPGMIAVVVFAMIAGCGPHTPKMAVVAVDWTAKFLLGKLADGIWDSATGKPDIKELDKRLSYVEKDMRAKGPECAEPVSDLRDKLVSDMKKDDYLSLEKKYRQQVNDRLDRLEEKVKRLETPTDEDKELLRQFELLNKKLETGLNDN
ncbi:MAG: hypothetical protein R3B84_14875 [Zavarzinella sp.]